jgi:DNA-binding HxlR family transcriptional regulator
MTEPQWSPQAEPVYAGFADELSCTAWANTAADGAEVFGVLQDVQRLFHGEWTAAILVVLSDGPKHYKQIRDHVRSLNLPDSWSGRPRVLHDGVLARTLKSMTAKELIDREQISASFPPSVRYALTPATAEALAAWTPVIDWARKHADLISRARMRARA